MPGLPIGPLELVLILGIALLILGPGKLPEVGSALGRTIREFRKASSDIQEATSLTPETGAASRRGGPPVTGPTDERELPPEARAPDAPVEPRGTPSTPVRDDA